MSEASPLVIGLDCSTTACKAVVWDLHGNAVSEGRLSLPMVAPQATWHEQPAETWWDATVQALRQAANAVDGGRFKAVCIAHQRESFVPVDEGGRPLCNGILWMDERARGVLPELERLFGKEDFHRQTGKPLSVNLTIAKIAWLKEHRPDVFVATRRFLEVHAFLVHKLTGLYCTSWASADPAGMFDMEQSCWAEALLKNVGIRPEQLPKAYPPGAVIGTVTAAAAKECGLPAGLPVVAGLGDGQAAGLGVNITRPGDAYLALGTSVISGAFSDRYVVDAAFRTMYGGIAGSYLLETVLLGGGYTISWFMEKMAGRQGQDSAQLQDFYEKAAGELPPGSEGLMVVPYWNSVLGPYWDPAASGIVIGWRGIHGLGHLYRAILEGIAFEQRLYTEGVEKALGQPVERYIAVGGGAASELWRQIIADVTGKPVFCASTSEAAALGAGILAAVGAGCFADVRQAARAMTRILPQPIKPNPSRYKCYTRLFEEVYRPLFPAIQPCLDRLASISDSEM